MWHLYTPLTRETCEKKMVNYPVTQYICHLYILVITSNHDQTQFWLQLILSQFIIILDIQNKYVLKSTINIFKVKILWESHKIWKKNLPHRFDVYSVLTSILGRRFFQIFLAFSDYLNFTLIQPSLLEKFCIQTNYTQVI